MRYDRRSNTREEGNGSTLSRPKAGSSPAAPQKDRESENDSKSLVTVNPNPASLQILIAFNKLGYHVYEGSVPKAVIARRRKANRTARISRRVNRGRH